MAKTHNQTRIIFQPLPKITMDSKNSVQTNICSALIYKLQDANVSLYDEPVDIIITSASIMLIRTTIFSPKDPSAQVRNDIKIKVCIISIIKLSFLEFRFCTALKFKTFLFFPLKR